MSFKQVHTVPKLAVPIRLQEYGPGIFNLIATKSALKKALKKQCITVNGLTATTATYIKGGETIEFLIPEQNIKGKSFVFPLKVIFEDNHLAVISKPAGILVSGNSFKTIANALAQNIKTSILEPQTVAQPVHRLDYGTTGLLLIGKTSTAIRRLNKMFEEGTINKSYFAVTIGEIKANGQINLPIGKKVATTYYKLIQSVSSRRYGRLNLVELWPQTGRRHQLRKHLSAIKSPILGDKEYGEHPMVLKGKGIYLHAHSLQFIHPFTKETMALRQALPEKFSKIFQITNN
ncbi:RluA family pseudouridine synthase [Eudoraea chungangensis]|uniref:RluA family pseudouridine synthase n=1 Tax=Eudoraea chungangensis TaxID=1481905 RepID=UPI0023EDAD18|nr:RluA family pseudouridine synthase [Eudoraea chungangensis]